MENNIKHQPALSKNGVDFIDDALLNRLIEGAKPNDAGGVRDVIAKSLSLEPLELEETAVLIKADSKELVDEIFDAARELKQKVYGARVVLFAPLYIGNECLNDCRYCGFRRSNPEAMRRTLTKKEIVEQVQSLEDKGHKRLILVFGEHPEYSPEYIADVVRTVYSVKKGRGEIRRVNVNAAPLSVEGFKTVHEAGIGTYQVFQETYSREAYRRYHPAHTPKGDYLYRLDSLSRAFEGGCDDVGTGVLFGLADWRFDVLGLVRHARFLKERYNVGPHTISFPRLRPASGFAIDSGNVVSDEEFKRLVAILRLSVPYTGMILTARESVGIRREIISFGISQIDAGGRIEIGGYTEIGDAQQVIQKEQFELGDMRSLDEVIRQLLHDGQIPSFCTACYRIGRTGEHFMEFAIPGFINRFCAPNALLTLMEYLVDYASPETLAAGLSLIEKEMDKIEPKMRVKLKERLENIRKSDSRDFYF